MPRPLSRPNVPSRQATPIVDSRHFAFCHHVQLCFSVCTSDAATASSSPAPREITTAAASTRRAADYIARLSVTFSLYTVQPSICINEKHEPHPLRSHRRTRCREPLSDSPPSLPEYPEWLCDLSIPPHQD